MHDWQSVDFSLFAIFVFKLFTIFLICSRVLSRLAVVLKYSHLFVIVIIKFDINVILKK